VLQMSGSSKGGVPVGESRYGIRMGRPTMVPGEPRVTKNVRLAQDVVNQVEAYRVRQGISTFTAALEELLRRSLAG